MAKVLRKLVIFLFLFAFGSGVVYLSQRRRAHPTNGAPRSPKTVLTAIICVNCNDWKQMELPRGMDVVLVLAGPCAANVSYLGASTSSSSSSGAYVNHTWGNKGDLPPLGYQCVTAGAEDTYAIAAAFRVLRSGHESDLVLVLNGAVVRLPDLGTLLAEWDAVDAPNAILGCSTATASGSIVQYGIGAFMDAQGSLLGVHHMHEFSVRDSRRIGATESDAVDPNCAMATRGTWASVGVHAANTTTEVQTNGIVHDACSGLAEASALLAFLPECIATVKSAGNDNIFGEFHFQNSELQDLFLELTKQMGDACATTPVVTYYLVEDLKRKHRRVSDTFDSWKLSREMWRPPGSLGSESSRVLGLTRGSPNVADILSALSSSSDDETERSVGLRRLLDKLIVELMPSVATVMERVRALVSSGQRSARFVHNAVLRTDGPELGWHLCLAASQCYVSSAVAVLVNPSAESAPSFAVSASVQQTWMLRHSHRLTLPVTRVVWTGWCCHCCGFSTEMAHIVYALSRLLDVFTLLRPACFCSGAPGAVTDTISRIYASDEDMTTLHNVSRGDVLVWVSHTDPMSFEPPSRWGHLVDYTVGRAMYEFTRIPRTWVAACNAPSLDEIWVPSSFVRDVFQQSGVNKTIVVVPEAMDPFYWNPAQHRRAVWNPKWRHRSNDPKLAGHFKGRKKFMSLFKWEPRKGWDVLLDAYFRTFSPSDKVSLYILTHVWFPGAESAKDDPNNATHVYEAIVAHARRRDPSTLPHFVVLTERLPEGTLASVYRAMDVFVLPTRGEGWCLPVMQAMAMGMPVVSTRWSGMLDYLTDDNAWLVDVDGMEDVPRDTPYANVEGAQWAKPSVSHLSDIFKMFTRGNNTAVVQARAQAARRTVLATYTEEAVAKIVQARIVVIQNTVRGRTRNWEEGGGRGR